MIQENPIPIWQSLVLFLQSVVVAPRRARPESSAWGCVPEAACAGWLFFSWVQGWGMDFHCTAFSVNPSLLLEKLYSSNLSAAVIYSLLLFIAELTSEQPFQPNCCGNVIESWKECRSLSFLFLSLVLI
ncbi:hypothetical protein KIL84_007930 [Mauremys mutica]|uniref:Uncharacterized protein n=1 Tax=Mauremys mutica TaxID=74926 RepID=A0A9D3X287_9SAUR|nr:hypothetical protein KIL84_007930 [Mauremys mutica]